MGKFIAGLIAGLLLVPAAAYVYLSQGMAPVATSAPPLPMERKLTHMALRARVAKEAPDHPPISAEESVYLAGAQIYRDNCAVCHGLLQQPKPTAIAQGMFPTPPRLFPGKGVSDDPPGETYWKVANGIRLTGMPGFKFSLSDVQVWQVSLLLANSNQLPASVQHLLTWGGEAGPAPANSMTK